MSMKKIFSNKSPVYKYQKHQAKKERKQRVASQATGAKNKAASALDKKEKASKGQSQFNQTLMDRTAQLAKKTKTPKFNFKKIPQEKAFSQKLAKETTINAKEFSEHVAHNIKSERKELKKLLSLFKKEDLNDPYLSKLETYATQLKERETLFNELNQSIHEMANEVNQFCESDQANKLSSEDADRLGDSMLLALRDFYDETLPLLEKKGGTTVNDLDKISQKAYELLEITESLLDEYQLLQFDKSKKSNFEKTINEQKGRLKTLQNAVSEVRHKSEHQKAKKQLVDKLGNKYQKNSLEAKFNNYLQKREKKGLGVPLFGTSLVWSLINLTKTPKRRAYAKTEKTIERSFNRILADND